MLWRMSTGLRGGEGDGEKHNGMTWPDPRFLAHSDSGDSVQM